jgi:hypothetical protein
MRAIATLAISHQLQDHKQALSLEIHQNTNFNELPKLDFSH